MSVLYPPAEPIMNGQTGGTYIGVPFRFVVHTTETAGIPTYNGGASAPHLTYDPVRRRWVQHTRLTEAARALRNVSGGVQTNRANAIQVEVVCYSAKNIADQNPARMWVGNLPQTAYDDLVDFRAFCEDEFGVTRTWPGKQALSYAQANAAGFRMTGPQWNAFTGMCGHQHVPENTHWDPGALDWGRLLTESDPEMPLNQVEKAVVDIAFSLLGAGGQRSYWYNKEPNDPEFVDLRNAVDTGAAALLARVSAGVTEARVKELIAKTKLAP